VSSSNDSPPDQFESPDAPATDDDLDLDMDIDVERIEQEERAAAARLSAIAAGRRKAGVFGAAAAGAMLGLRDVFEGPPKDDTIVAIAESPGGPGDIDTDGISVTVGDVDVWAPPPAARDHDDQPDS
jgi:hypothetical protein